jgi:hypothetical protein
MACKEWDQVVKSPIDGWRTIGSQEIRVFVKWQGKEWKGGVSKSRVYVCNHVQEFGERSFHGQGGIRCVF